MQSVSSPLPQLELDRGPREETAFLRLRPKYLATPRPACARSTST